MISDWKNTTYNLVLILLFTYSCMLMGEITWRYRNFELDASFLQIKQTEVTQISWYKYAFYIHVISAVLALPAGFTQFNKTILRNYPRVHHVLGYLYVAIILGCAAPSGFLIGMKANGGLIAQIAFTVLACLWFYYTLQAVLRAKIGDFKAHKNFMIRSFALTCSALTLRYWKVILVYFFHPNPMDLYQLIAWLGWIPNLLLAEWIINQNK
ncbi:MAG TPA: DUF2306 domain-containing protein [Sphingobacterium sp.]|jgi:uncharacterized membrane protein|uniref:DUF2306 domain-containing protein n=2 Tax=Sphingobacterium TaxID=28453 RepID=UPI0004E5F442|nr:DUF2306 domain-containing protein [Sphingobacterium sp. UBA6320]CDS92331.1 conserved membrane hypothetical protein [Sphingobacterium sp. PM2-P1-29]SJN52236.1 membrane protein, putative [Sphingobacterium faecium PCAi_F2.5]HCU46769.1 DUF2306 domain-containing protein [Sphingobacterium sp.]